MSLFSNKGKPRRLTQLSSLEVYKAGLNGIYYRSRYGHDLENWALFEPFQIREKRHTETIHLDDPDLLVRVRFWEFRSRPRPGRSRCKEHSNIVVRTLILCVL
jgi:hypothetical protein